VKRVRGVAYTTKVSPQARRARQFHSKIHGKIFEVNGYFWSHRADEYQSNMKMNLEIHIRFEETSIDTQTIFGVHLIWMLKNGLEFQAQKASRPLLLIKGLRFGDSQVTSASSYFMFLELFLYQVVYISWPSWQP